MCWMVRLIRFWRHGAFDNWNKDTSCGDGGVRWSVSRATQTQMWSSTVLAADVLSDSDRIIATWSPLGVDAIPFSSPGLTSLPMPTTNSSTPLWRAVAASASVLSDRTLERPSVTTTPTSGTPWRSPWAAVKTEERRRLRAACVLVSPPRSLNGSDNAFWSWTQHARQIEMRLYWEFPWVPWDSHGYGNGNHHHHIFVYQNQLSSATNTV